MALAATGACRSGPEQWGPFRGQVVDADTGQPLSGAHVMVTWVREPPSLHFSQRFYDAQEAMTDRSGRFEIARRSRVLTAFVASPGIGVFVPGYRMQSHEVVPPGGRAYVDPTVVKMRPLRTREEQCQYEPYGTGALVPKSRVPRYSTAVDAYVATLRCVEPGRP